MWGGGGGGGENWGGGGWGCIDQFIIGSTGGGGKRIEQREALWLYTVEGRCGRKLGINRTSDQNGSYDHEVGLAAGGIRSAKT